ncbi:hypothetical protein DAEQUDRAFT_768669 [Daedalea quercina L-15889]|uniref:Uncharacterized protein n=1 Tax=Daedalea quercina L-15889 TaxID=1314783 RepID=A0A165MF94_9APHY|nr:hypothetical protein DAEQUDRAFT_768669 [Daedalea quercina L-15889]
MPPESSLSAALEISSAPHHSLFNSTLVEAFSVAGCDFMSFYCTPREKAEHLRKLIQWKILEGLVKITGEQDVRMEYVKYEQEMIAQRGIVLHGWLLSEFKNLSELSTSLPPLKAQYQALVDGMCHWDKATPDEHEAARKGYSERLASSQIRPRKQCSNKGKKHARPKNAKGKGKAVQRDEQGNRGASDIDRDDEDEDENENENDHPQKRHHRDGAVT